MLTRLPPRLLVRPWLASAAFGLSLIVGPFWSAHAQTTADPEEVVRLDAFNVGTTIGHYHEETSSMATKIPTDLKEVASSLQILNASALADRDTLKLQDVYTYIVGMSQAQTNANGFAFRGFANTGSFTQNIEYDGLQGGVSQKGALSAVDVQSVEFLKGPNSVLYGQMHPGGLLNIVTKSPQATAQASLTAEYSTYDGRTAGLGDQNSYVGIVDLTGPIDTGKHWLYRIVASEQDLHVFRKGDWEKDLFVYPSLTYRWTPDTSLSFKVEAVRVRRRQDDGLVPIFTRGITFGPSAAYTLPQINRVYQEQTDTGFDKGQAYSAVFQTRFADRWTLHIADRTVYHRDITREYTQQSQTVTVANPIQNSTITRNYNNFNNAHRYSYFDAYIYGVIGSPSFENTVMGGVGGGVESFDNNRLGNGPKAGAISLYNPVLGVTPYPPDGSKVSDSKQTLSNIGAYVSDVIKLANRWHVSVGTRYDQQAAHGIDVLNPVTTPYAHQFVTAQTSSFGAVYDLTNLLSAYVTTSQSFVPNAVTLLDANGHSGFSPEKGYQIEGGFKYELPDRSWYAAVDAYFINRTNVVVQTPLLLPNGQQINRLDGVQHSEGVEFETEWQPFPYWQFQGGIALGKAFVAESGSNPATVGSSLVDAPHVTASFWSRYNVPDGPLKGLGLGLGVVNTGNVWTGDPTTAFYFRVPGWTRVDTNLYYKWKRYQFSLECKNLLDRQYILIPQSAVQLFPGEPRKLTVAVTTHF
jgi:iron complex outermembrane receptor protein